MIKTLKGRISLVYICLVLMIAIVGFVSVINLYLLSKTTSGLMIDNYVGINATNKMIESLQKQEMSLMTYLNIDKQKGVEMFSQCNTQFLKWYSIEYNSTTELREQKNIQRINEHYTQYIKLFSQLQDIQNVYGIEKSSAFYTTAILPILDNLNQELKVLLALNEEVMFNSKTAATKNTQKNMYAILILSMVAVSSGFIMSLFFTNRFLRPINLLTQSIKLVKAGDLNQQIEITTQDEIGELSSEFNNMTKRLLQYEKSTKGKLMSEKNKSLAIVKSISDPLIVLDTNYRIILLNDACEDFFDIIEENAINKNFLEVIKNSELFDHISNIFLTKNDENKQKIIYAPSKGKDYYFNVVTKAIKGMDGSIKEIVILLQNVTQLKQLEKVKSNFISTISHEFKTPLTSIMMGASLIMNQGIGSITEGQKKVMITIQEDTERLSTLVVDLLELSKIESSNAIFNIKPSSIVGIINNSFKNFFDQTESKDITLSYELDEDLPDVNVDAEKISWVLNNLISNSFKYTNAGDSITVEAFIKNDKMCISVKDTGVGIPPEYIGKIFEKFIDVKGPDSEIRGTGLGLAISKEIVEAHGGEIWCESKLDVGSVFTFTLPIVKVK